MEASISQNRQNQGPLEALIEDFSPHRHQLEDLFENWQKTIFSQPDPPSLVDLAKRMKEDSAASDELLTQISGPLALMALDSKCQNPLQAYNAAQSAVIKKTQEEDINKIGDEESLIDLLLLIAYEAANNETASIADSPRLEALHMESAVVDVDIASDELAEPLPALADERSAESFYVGQKLLLLVDKSLKVATVKKAEAYTLRTILAAPIKLPKEEIKARQARLKKHTKQIDNFGIRNQLAPIPQNLRFKISTLPEFQTVIRNPSPGLLHLVYEEGDPGIITDMNHNHIITEQEWPLIRDSESYRESWLQNGSKESLRMSSVLKAAIEKRRHSRSELLGAASPS